MKKLLLTLMLLPAIALSAGAETKTLQLSSSAKFEASGSTLTQGGVTWTYTYTGSGTEPATQNYISDYNGQQFGKSKTQWQGSFSTSDIAGTITKVVVKCNSGSGKAQAWVTVNGVAFGGDAKTISKKSGDVNELEFTGSASGEIVVYMAETETGNSAKAVYLNSIEVTYTTGGTPSTVPSITTVPTAAFGTVETGATKTINVDAANLTDEITATWTTGGIFSCASSLPAEGGELVITLEKTTSGACSDVLTLTSGTTSATINVSATVLDMDGDGSFENPYTVADVKTLNNGKSGSFWVKGIILGAWNGSKFDNNTDTNILLADDNSATGLNDKGGIAVQLPEGDLRKVLNVKDNADNIEKTILVYGSLEKYFSNNPGVKSLSDYAFYTEDAYVVADDKANVEKNTRVASVTYVRADLDLSKWHSICLPFAVPAEKWASDYKVITLSETQETEGAVDFNYVATDATLAAKTPYLIKAVDPATTAISVSLSDPLIIYAGTTKVSDGSYVHLHGTLAETDLQDNTTNLYYALKDGVFRNAGSSAAKTLGRYRAYLEVTANQGKPQLQVNVEGETSGIEAVTTNAAMEDGVFYNLKGQRVDNPDKGIYIFNGMKVIIK